MSRLSAVGDLGQQLADAFYIGLTPNPHANADYSRELRKRNLLFPEIFVERSVMKPELLRGLPCRIFHSNTTSIRYEKARQEKNQGKENTPGFSPITSVIILLELASRDTFGQCPRRRQPGTIWI